MTQLSFSPFSVLTQRLYAVHAVAHEEFFDTLIGMVEELESSREKQMIVDWDNTTNLLLDFMFDHRSADEFLSKTKLIVKERIEELKKKRKSMAGKIANDVGYLKREVDRVDGWNETTAVMLAASNG